MSEANSRYLDSYNNAVGRARGRKKNPPLRDKCAVCGASHPDIAWVGVCQDCFIAASLYRKTNLKQFVDERSLYFVSLCDLHPCMRNTIDPESRDIIRGAISYAQRLSDVIFQHGRHSVLVNSGYPRVADLFVRNPVLINGAERDYRSRENQPGFWLLLTEQEAGALKKVLRAVQLLVLVAEENGFALGKNLLTQLANGDINNAEFERRTRARDFKLEEEYDE